VRFYVHIARLLVNERVSAGGVDMSWVSARDVPQFNRR
jgi:hypothetical protein